MERQRWEAPEKRTSGKRKGQKKEDAGARKGRKVAIHNVVCPMICGSGGSRSRLAKATGAEPSGQMRHGEVACHCGANHISISNFRKQTNIGTCWEDEMFKKGTRL